MKNSLSTCIPLPVPIAIVKYLTNCEAAATSSGDGGLTVMVKISPSAA